MQKPKRNNYTVDEYFAFEESQEERYEFHKGEIVNISGASINHNRIVMNISADIGNFLKSKTCEVYSLAMRVWVEENDVFTYPDILVICDSPKFYSQRNDTITNPLIIVEVLSESTRNYDRGDKFMFYRSLASFKEYILVDQYAVHVEHFYKTEDGKWVLTEYNSMDNTLVFIHLNFQISITDIYNKVDFQEKIPVASDKESLA
jgi:Uma2 family endonuclease